MGPTRALVPQQPGTPDFLHPLVSHKGWRSGLSGLQRLLEMKQVLLTHPSHLQTQAPNQTLLLRRWNRTSARGWLFLAGVVDPATVEAVHSLIPHPRRWQPPRGTTTGRSAALLVIAYVAVCEGVPVGGPSYPTSLFPLLTPLT